LFDTVRRQLIVATHVKCVQARSFKRKCGW